MNLDLTLVWNAVLKKHPCSSRARVIWKNEDWTREQKTWVKSAEEALTTCVILDKATNLSVFSFIKCRFWQADLWELSESFQNLCLRREPMGKWRTTQGSAIEGGWDQNFPLFIMKLWEAKSKFLPILHTSIPSWVTPRTTASFTPPKPPCSQSHIKSHHLIAMYLQLGPQTCCVYDSLSNTRITGEDSTLNKSDTTIPPKSIHGSLLRCSDLGSTVIFSERLSQTMRQASCPS